MIKLIKFDMVNYMITIVYVILTQRNSMIMLIFLYYHSVVWFYVYKVESM